VFAPKTDWVRTTPWQEAAAQFCTTDTKTLDASQLRQFLGRQLDDPAVQHLLMAVGDGALPSVTSGIIPAGRVAGFDFDPKEWKDFSARGVTFSFIDDRLEFISLDARFDGVLPLGLSWADQKAAVETRLGSPRCCNDPGANGKVWYEYKVGDCFYVLGFYLSGELANIEIEPPWGLHLQ